MSKPRTEQLGVQTGASTDGKERSRLWWPMFGAAVGALAVVVSIAALTTRASGDARRRQVGLPRVMASISIEPFTTTDTLHFWNSQTFAESLGVQLANIRGLDVRVGRRGRAVDFTLRGDVARRDGRLVITTRLGRTGDAESTVWTATYWRSENPGGALTDEIAAGVAEALYSNLIRLDLTSKSRR